MTLLVLCAVVATAACQRREDIWFAGDFEAATAAARERDTVVLLEFQTGWCSWCRRLEKDTFAAPEVRERLRQMIVLRLDGEGDGEELANRFGVDSFPTVVITGSDGSEIDRIIGYLPPAEFLAQADQILLGDTFVACLRRLRENPADADAIVGAVAGLLERSDPEGAISRINAFHASGEDHDQNLCNQLMFKARTALQDRVYGFAAKLYRKGWDGSLRTPNTEGTENLYLLVGDDTAGLDQDELAHRLRRARFADAGELLDLVTLENASPQDLRRIGDFAFRNGHYDTAAEAYERWFAAAGDSADADTLNAAAWQLSLAGRSTTTALEIARRSWRAGQTADIADTLARLLYVSGEVDEAIGMQRRAVEMATGETEQTFTEALELMEAGRDLGDAPAFESYPQGPKATQASTDTTVI